LEGSRLLLARCHRVSWLDATEYVVFFVVFFLGVLMTPKG